MAKVIFAAYLFALTIGSAAAYAKDCAVGPEYWCKSFENAQDCGALRHCSDTVWNSDDKYASTDPSTTCRWCERILEKIHQGLGDKDDLIISTLTGGCNLLPSADLSTKCTNVVENYGASVVPLMKNKRFATLCRLMNICTSEKSPMALGSKRCTWGPSYWCSSLSNSRECGSTDHCSNQIWSKQAIEKKENDNVCQYCEYTIDKLRSIVDEDKTFDNAEKWLNGACLMLQTQEAIDQCVQTMSQYGEEILVLVKNQIDSGIICHLGQMCKDATIITRKNPSNQQSKMLCNVIVRATHDLHVNEQKRQGEIERFLKNDCQQLATSNLRKQCGDIVGRYAGEIYDRVVNNMELSKICDETALQPLSHVRCDLCTFVLSTTKAMLDAKHPEDKVLSYIDEQFCAQLDGSAKENCKYIIGPNGEDLIAQIKQGKQPMLLCLFFQVCLHEVVDTDSSIQKEEMRAFFKESICDHMGIFEESCNAMIVEQDTTHLLKTLVNNLDGDVLCQIFGICPRKMSLIDSLSLNDDPDKCKRCVADFTRRKHIAEKLVNHSSEFLHHLCGQLPNKDECIKAVDEPMKKLVEFIQSLDPKDICVELKACNQTLVEDLPIASLENAMSETVNEYIRNEICARLGPLSKWCDQLVDTELGNLINTISKGVDPHQVCSVIDICPNTRAFDNCNDKCECCITKVENYQVQLAAFLQTLLSTTESVCESIPYSKECREIASGLKSKIDDIISNFNSKRICEVFSHCSPSSAQCEIDGNKCQCCQNNLKFRQANFRRTINESMISLSSFCTTDDCRSNVQSKSQGIVNQIDRIDFLTLCQRIGYCTTENSERIIPFLSDLLIKTYSNFGSAVQDVSKNLCASFGDLQPVCEHLLGSGDNTRYRNVYMAFLKGDPTLIEEDFHAQSTNTCDGCKKAVQNAKDFWLNSLESVRNALLKTCDYCSAKDRCRDFYNQRFDNLTSCVKRINPEQFCRNIHLCSVALTNTCSTCVERFDGRKDAALQAIDRLAGYFDDLCQKYAGKECQTYVQEMKNSFQQSIEDFNTKDICNSIGFCGTEEEMDFDQYEKYIEDEMEKNICSILGPFETLCKGIIHGDTEQIQSLQMNYKLEDLMKIGEELTDDSTEPDGKDQCECCVARIIRKKRRVKFIGDMIYYSLIRSCDRCPAKQQCRRFYKLQKILFDKRIEHICPYMVCIRLGYCNKTNGSSEVEVQVINPIDDSNATCILCDYVMKILSTYIHQQSTEEEMEENLEKICDQIPAVLQNQCQEYITNYGPTIISLLIKEFDLSKICQKLNLCTDQMKIDATHLIKADTATCGVCNYVSTYVHNALQRASNDKSFQRTLATVCTNLADEQNLKCQMIVQLFGPSMRQLELSSKNNFCKQLTICQIPMANLQPGIIIQKEPTIVKDPNATPTCTICQYVISYLDAALKNNKSEEAIEAALAKVCTILPKKERDECSQLIKTYGPAIAELIAESADPDTICRYLGVCEKSTTMIQQTPHTCTICQYVVSRMKYFTGLSQDANEILTSLKASCDLFSVENLKKQCKDFLNRYASHFSAIMSNDIEPKIACQGIGICTNKPRESTTAAPVEPVTKYGKCIFGMSYWCTSRANAQLCNAVELCERHVWSKQNLVIT